MIKLTPVKYIGGQIENGQTHEPKRSEESPSVGVAEGQKISQEEAAKRLDITTRQVRRLSKRYRAAGMDGLISKKRGSASNRRLDDTIRTTAINLIGTHYRDFGPTLACEKLVELHDLQVSIETTRQLMIGAGYWHPKKAARYAPTRCVSDAPASAN